MLLGRLLVTRGSDKPDEPDAASHWLTVEQAAERANLPVSWIRTATKDGRLPSRKIGHYRRIDSRDLEKFLVESPSEA
jgi:excisionase family DNA binding protein